MKTHLPKGLRAALVAAFAAVSITTAYGAAPLIKDQYAVDWTKVTLTNRGQIVGDTGGDVFCPTVINREGYYNGCEERIDHIYVVGGGSRYLEGDIYFDVINAWQRDNRSIIGLNDLYTAANIYARIGNAQSNHTVNDVTGVGLRSRLRGNVYMELADSKATYTQTVSGSRSSDITGSSTLVIRAGTFQDKVAAGFSAVATGGSTIGGGSYLQIEGGTFQQEVVAGSIQTSGTATITGGSHLLINGGTFNKNVYGGSKNANSTTINGGVDITVSGGTFNANSNIYALGSAGTVNGAVSLTIGNGAKFSSNSVISAGTDGSATYSGTSSTVTLKDLTGTSSLATNSTIKVDGGQQKSVLVMDKVNATIQAKLSNFTSMNVTNGSALTLTQATNADLGGASTVTIDSGSTLTLNAAGQTWDLSGKNLKGQGTLDKQGTGKLAISRDSSTFNGNVNIGAGTLEVQNAMNANTLSGSGKLAKTGAGKMSVEDASDFTGDILATGGTLELEKVGRTDGKVRNVSVITGATVNLLGVSEDVNVSLHELVIDNGTLGVYVGDTPVAGENEANVGVLTLTGGNKIVVGGKGGTLEANLTTECDSILDFTSGGVLTMGCDLTVGEGTIVLLNASDYATLAEGGSVTLFSGVDNDAMEASNVSIYLNTVESADKMLAQVSFSSENGSVSVSVVPEPATATLSLLALAGLAARRRRSKAVAA